MARGDEGTERKGIRRAWDCVRRSYEIFRIKSLASDFGTGENLSPFKGRKRSHGIFFLPLKVKVYGEKDGLPVK